MIKKFSEIKRPVRKINEQDETSETPMANLPQNIKSNEEPKEETSMEAPTESTPAKLFSKLFESREMAHIYHLQVRGDEGSYAAHMALGSFYEDVLDLIDDLIETYQGQYDIVEGYDIIDTKDTKSKEKVEYFTELADFIKTERKCISSEDSHLHNIVDEILALTYKTLYKLKFNK